MLPFKDDVPRQRLPLVTGTVLLVNVVAFLYQFTLQFGGADVDVRAGQELVAEFGAIPCRITDACATTAAVPPVLGIFTSMFLHGGVFHVFGNMLYLWIFGKSVEDALGHARFLVLYLVAGLAGAVAQTAMTPESAIPMIGASGAVSGVLGAYLALFPFASVLTLVTFGFFIRVLRIPALVVLGFWIVVQLVNGLITYSAGPGSAGDGGVALFADVGGFLAGMALLFLLRPRAARL